MSDPAKLLGFGLILAAALGIGYGVGTAVGPLGDGSQGTSVGETSDMPADHS